MEAVTDAIDVIKVYWKERGKGRDGLTFTYRRLEVGKAKKILLDTVNSVLFKYRVQQ